MHEVCKPADVILNSSKSMPNSKKSSGERVGCFSRDRARVRRPLNLMGLDQPLMKRKGNKIMNQNA
ncbi:unnamed protein product [Acanthoscelides obtectus]|uniref:Uncharacterized protein n=1 Tax=Acanthoscelides obtectus TaxID=200917 RepID=A0A9P0KFR9_ACAOB|nr:unnamed protein product [Acanthoscelides obtectus]CAK1654509.1 hypothetical protein AOBTE_LOCUS18648 [Acanthoscelides obtectus]